ncbi:MAG: succinate dehydrogenase assembly factor 2 [Rhodobacteraceae bacterium]|uniref:FAD assembly factor SdhE n=1 Tax=Tabrizicola sp. SY72 TaxID=2741673 RepID=UPI001571724C|nr:succinate dehydrogenase assembly factor 2 [Tabrizicola sp. SY72]MBL9057125.1 succinate dehydrogenase assembly factor 2 [Paracoccaceae bacterium]NTT86015.1 succinate dehydrogenase assembly factor 2 [Tabrizicola sp. SY72]
MSETAEARLKRMAMRSWRRGTKEMDLILGPYGDARLAAMAPETLDLYDALLHENDQDLLPWVLGQTPPPPPYAALIAEIAAFARSRLAPQPR